MYIWRKVKHIHKRQTHVLVREDVTYGLLPQGFSWKKSLVVSLKGPDTMTTWLKVNLHSQIIFDFEFDFDMWISTVIGG
jgi:hypothetical protein